MTHPSRAVVHVRETLAGWWDISVDDGRGAQSLAQYTSEFQAREAGRINAVRLEADLVIHQSSAPSICQAFDAVSGALRAPGDESSRS